MDVNKYLGQLALYENREQRAAVAAEMCGDMHAMIRHDLNAEAARNKMKSLREAHGTIDPISETHPTPQEDPS